MFGGLERGPEPPRMAEINVTPLVDVMLVLLVIFIITAPLLAHSLKLDLPQESASPIQPDPQTLRIAIDAQGQLHWNETPVSVEELRERLGAAAAGGAQPEIALRADKSTRYEQVAQVLAAAQEAGLTRLGLVTEPRP